MMRKVCLFLGLLLGTAVSLSAQKRFESKELQQAAALLSKEMASAGVVYRFAEEYFNRMLAASAQERVWHMAADDVQVEAGAFDNLHLVNKESSLAISSRENRYVLGIANGEFTVIRVSFPMSYQLISGKSRRELEEMFIHDVQTVRMPADTVRTTADKRGLQKKAPHLYVKKGNEYYIDAINNDLYYTEDADGVCSLVASSEHLLESIANALLSEEAAGAFSLELKVRRYGFKTDTLRVGLGQWLAYCKDAGCELFVGMTQVESDRLKASLFAVNHSLKYNHVMSLEFPYALIDERKGVLKAAVHIFIPTHNLSGLFEEMNFVNGRGRERKISQNKDVKK